MLCGYYVCNFIEAGAGKYMRFPDEDDASKDVSSGHFVTYLAITFVLFS